MSDRILIGFDFSISKPAMTILFPNGKYKHYMWPQNFDKKLVAQYKENDVYCVSRDLDAVSKKNYTSSELVKIHTKRSIDLANLIVETIKNEILSFYNNDIKSPLELFISSEGLAFGSKGDATLDLATYKGVLLAKLYENFADNEIMKLSGLYTYSPISIKSVAGCATKEKKSDKNAMIHAYALNNVDTKFNRNLNDFVAKKNFKKGVDDIVDSYFALKTMIDKECL